MARKGATAIINEEILIGVLGFGEQYVTGF